MNLKIHQPAPPLADYVHSIWACIGYQSPFPMERVLPGGMIEITFVLDDTPFVIYDTNRQPHTFEQAFAAGARSTHYLVATARPLTFLSVYFKPGGAKLFLGVAGDELHNCHTELDTVWGMGADALYSQLMAAKSVDQQFHIIETRLTERLHHPQHRHPAIAHAVVQLADAPQRWSMKELATLTGLNRQRFIQLFREDVGMTPKQFSRIQRFRQLLRQMTDANAPADWAELALRCGYYDQAHLINDFRAITGITPTEYVPSNPLAVATTPYVVPATE